MTSLAGFKVSKNAREAPREWRSGGKLDFVFENPLDGRFKDIDCVRKLLHDYAYAVKQVPTSYCHYDYDYRKRTVFIGTLSCFSPKPPCPDLPCPLVRGGNFHRGRVADCSAVQKNSIPPALVDLLIDAWLALHPSATSHLLIDVFSGWGSIHSRVRDKQQLGCWKSVKVFSNDIVDRPHTDAQLDMRVGTPWTPGSLLVLALAKLYPAARPGAGGAVAWVREAGVAVLFFCSTPCETYSQNALCKHREAGSAAPKTANAVVHDHMNAKLVAFFERVVLGA